MFELIIGVVVLILGIPIGNLLKKYTKEELKSGQKWFRLIVIFGLIGGIVGLVLGNEVLMFSLFFIAIATSRSLENKKNKKSS